MVIQQPSNQIKLTNVSIVRLKKAGKRFEIACYKNKVQEWRNGVETDIDDVLQIANVFVNVSKGEVAKKEVLKKVFNTTDTEAIVKEILQKGEVQVGDKERGHDLSSTRREIVALVAEKCVDPSTKRPYPPGVIDKALTEAGFSVSAVKTAKAHVSECIKLLQTESNLPIERAKMRIKLSLPAADAEKLREKILENADTVEKDEQNGDGWETIILIDPSQLRVINDLRQKECENRGQVAVLYASDIPQSAPE